MPIDLSSFAGTFAILYADVFSVYRYENTVDEIGVTVNQKKLVPEIHNVMCLLSPESEGRANPRPDFVLDQDQIMTLHCSPTVELKNGDFIVAKKIRNDTIMAVYRGTIGTPKKYPTHIKASFKVDSITIPE